MKSLVRGSESEALFRCKGNTAQLSMQRVSSNDEASAEFSDCRTEHENDCTGHAVVL